MFLDERLGYKGDDWKKYGTIATGIGQTDFIALKREQKPWHLGEDKKMENE